MSTEMMEVSRRRAAVEKAKDAVVTYVRGLEPVLRDHGANNSADRLMAMLGEVDALDRDLHAYVVENAEAVFAGMIGMIGRGPR